MYYIYTHNGVGKMSWKTSKMSMSGWTYKWKALHRIIADWGTWVTEGIGVILKANFVCMSCG